ncbi:family 2 encapsulin nanocompartment cargo protein terpene cyclase [Actinophytocola sp.]|uniref:family 2 encapsulin nanocompartment cargo protein terpene cyclase n=1 Tax=Actinophytocola sp. TaxID=1872138 RepID=UPI003D6C2F59
MLAPAATHDLAGAATALLSDMDGAPAASLPDVARRARQPVLGGPTGLGTSHLRLLRAEPVEDAPEHGLFCPGALRDDRVLGEQVNGDLIEWAEEVGIYRGQVDRLREADFGRLMMLTHPGTDDPDRLLAAAKCVLAEWATDDHFVDEESMGADPEQLGFRLGLTHAAMDPADLPVDYGPALDKAIDDEPVAVAYRSAFGHLARYATPTQLFRQRDQLTIMFMAYNHEANWRVTKRVPPVWEYLTHRHQNSFLPPMAIVDVVPGYELPAAEFADSRVRRVFSLAGSASVILNDVYSNSKESDDDFDLPKVIATEEQCSPREALDRTVEIHNELMHTFVAEAAALSQVGSPELRRFLVDLWAWLGGNREWHSTTGRYHEKETAR